MTRRTRLNVILAVIAIALAGGLWLSRTTPPAPPQPLLSVDRSAIRHIEIRTATAPAVVLARRQGRWQLLAPIHTRADTHAVNNLLAIADLAPQRRLAADGIGSRQTGLAQPAATLVFNGATKLAIGERLPIADGSGQRYVRSGDTLAIASIPHAGLLDMPWPRWVDPQLLADNARIQALHLPGLALTRSATGGWQVRPMDKDLGADATQFLLDAWRRATALTVTAATDKPALATVELVFADDRTRQMVITARQPRLILRDPRLGIAYHLAGDMTAALLTLHVPAPGQPAGADNPRQRPDRNGATGAQRRR